MKKILSLVACVLFAANAFAGGSPLKNLYTVAEVYPAGAGEIYLAPKNAEQAKYVADQSKEYGEYAFIKETIGENGNPEQYSGNTGYEVDASGDLGMYEEMLYIKPAAGYEFVCVANAVDPSGVYAPENCYQSHTGDGSLYFEFSWDYNVKGGGNLINVNSGNHDVDGNTNDDGGQAGVFEKAIWNEEPDTHLFVIFKQKAASAGSTKIYFEPLTIKAGEEQTIGLILENSGNIQSLEYTFTLPKGLSLKKAVRVADRLDKEEHEFYCDPQGGNTHKISVFSVNGNNIIGNDGPIAMVTLAADKTFDGSGSITADAVLVSDKVDENGNPVKVDTETPNVEVNKLTGQLIVTPEDITFNAESNKSTVHVGLESNLDIYGLQFQIEVPEGISFVKKANGNVAFEYTDRMQGNLAVRSNLVGNKLNVIVNDGDDCFVGTEGELFSFEVEGDLKTLAAESEIKFLEVNVSDESGTKSSYINEPVIKVSNTYEADEKARQEANLAAATADMELVEALQAELSEIIKDNEKFLSEENVAAIEAFLGDTYAMMIQEALDAVAESGVYQSPIDEAALRAIIAGIKADIEAAKAAEEARVAANFDAAMADMELVEALQAELSEIIKGNDKFLSEENVAAIEAFLGDTYAMMIQEALDAVAEEGVYQSPIDEAALRAIIAGIKADIEAAQAAEAARVAANNAAYEADLELIATLQAEFAAEFDGLPVDGDADYLALKETIEGLKALADAALAAVEEEGEYESPVDADAIRKEIERVKTLLGITNINAAVENGIPVYNMQGLRVKTASKGVFIVNGKKVVVK